MMLSVSSPRLVVLQQLTTKLISFALSLREYNDLVHFEIFLSGFSFLLKISNEKKILVNIGTI